MRNPHTMSPRLYFSIHSRGPNRGRTSQLLNRHRTSRHLLRSSPLSLRLINRGCLCYPGRLRSLIPFILRIHPPQHLNKNPLRSYICRRQPYILSTTLPRACGHATSILRLPRRLHPLKHCLLYRIPNLPSRSNHVSLYPLRSICRQTRSPCSRIIRNQRRMTPRLPSPLSHIRRARLCPDPGQPNKKRGS